MVGAVWLFMSGRATHFPSNSERARRGAMKILAITFRRWARGLMLLGVLFLVVAPGLPAMAMQPKDDCCPDVSCHGEDGKAVCPTACVMACHAIVAPAQLISEPLEHGPMAVTWPALRAPAGRTPAPELPPPR